MFKFLNYGLSIGFAIYSLTASAQTTIYSENFNGGTNTFTLNTGDASSTASPVANQWIVNSSYAGGNGSFVCLSFPFTFSAGATPSQPAGIAGNPNSGYMHIMSFAAQSSGFSNASYMAADGFCTFDEYNFTKMTNNISTTGFDSIELSFWWMCGGETGTNYGEVYYSTNNGSTWTVVNTPISQYTNQTNWIQQKISLPAFENLATLRFGFRFVNETATGPIDPGFAIDDVMIKGFSSSSIAAANVTGTSFCPGDAINVGYTASGAFTGANTFTAQLSDASGSFAAPVVLGSITSAATSGTINGTIPMGTAAGTGYRVRVVASAPATVGADNGLNLTINAQPNAGLISLSSGLDTICPGTSIALMASGVVGNLEWEQSTDGNVFFNIGITSNPANFTPMQSTWYHIIATNSCGVDTSANYYIHTVPTPVASFNYSQNGGSLDITFTNNTTGTFTGSVWQFGDGFSGMQTNPTYGYDSAGTYVVTLSVTNAQGCTSSFTDTITVMPISGLMNVSALNASLSVFPNPNNGQFTTQWEWASSGDVNIVLLDIQGRQLSNLYNGFLASGKHYLAADVADLVQTGVYILQIQTNLGTFHHKLIID